MNNENIKNLLQEQTKEIKRHIDVVREDFDSRVSLIAEQHESVNKKLDSHSEMIGAIKEDVEITKIDVGFIKNSLKKKIDVEEFAAAEKRISLLEAKARY